MFQTLFSLCCSAALTHDAATMNVTCLLFVVYPRSCSTSLLLTIIWFILGSSAVTKSSLALSFLYHCIKVVCNFSLKLVLLTALWIFFLHKMLTSGSVSINRWWAAWSKDAPVSLVYMIALFNCCSKRDIYF